MTLSEQLLYMVPTYMLEAVGSYRFLCSYGKCRYAKVPVVIIWTLIYSSVTTLLFVSVDSDYWWHDGLWLITRGGIWCVLINVFFVLDRWKVLFFSITYLTGVHLSRFIIISVGMFLVQLKDEILTLILGDVSEIPRWTYIMAYLLCIPIYAVILYVYRKMLKKYLFFSIDKMNLKEFLFLIWPCVVSLGIVLTLRILIGSGGYGDNPALVYLVPIVCVFLLTMIVIEVMLYRKMKDYQMEAESRKRLEEQLIRMRREIHEIEDMYADIRTMRHDLNGHIANLSALFQSNTDKKEWGIYIDRMQKTVDRLEFSLNTGNPITDVICNRYAMQAERNGVRFTSEFAYPKDSGVDGYDIGIILSNALENALAASCGYDGKPFISLRSYLRKGLFFIEVKNSFVGELILEEETGLPATTKTDGKAHGQGLISIRRQAEKYLGGMDIEILENKEFLLVVYMQV